MASCVPGLPSEGIEVAVYPEASPAAHAATADGIAAWNDVCPGLFKLVRWDRGLNNADVIVMESPTDRPDGTTLGTTSNNHVITLYPLFHSLDTPAQQAVTVEHELGHALAQSSEHAPEGTRAVMAATLDGSAMSPTSWDVDFARRAGHCLVK